MKPDSLPANNRVLVVDDNPTIHDDFQKILMSSDSTGESDPLAGLVNSIFDGAAESDFQPSKKYEVDSASQGREGLAKVEAALLAGRPYAVAFVDMRMPPGWDGVETIIEVWKKDPRLQIVVCTAYSDYSWDEVITRVGNHDNLVLLKKPFENAEVVQLVRVLSCKWLLAEQVVRLSLEP